MAKNQPAATPPTAESAPVEQPDVQVVTATPEAADAPSNAVKARVLRDCEFGSVNDVVEVPDDQLENAIKSGCVDPHPDAVAYAESLQ